MNVQTKEPNALEANMLAMGRAARALAEERYSWADVARRLEETYMRVAA